MSTNMQDNRMVSKLCSIIGFVGLIHRILPAPMQQWLDITIEKLVWERLFLVRRRGPDNLHVRLEVPEKMSAAAVGSCINPAFTNSLYNNVRLYLSSLHSPLSQCSWLNVYTSCDNENVNNSFLSFSLPLGQTMEDKFQGVTVSWTSGIMSDDMDTLSHNQHFRNPHRSSRTRLPSRFSHDQDQTHNCLILEFLQKDRNVIIPHYLQHICKVAKDLEAKNSQLYLYTNQHGNCWQQIPFDHPSTFDTLALDPKLSERVMADLVAFSKAKAFYQRVGRPWKRGYLLYGPPGTGKSSMVAAIANLLHYDIYDLELSKVHGNNELKSLLIQTTRKSIIVIEDIDCTLLQDLKINRMAPEESSASEFDDNTSQEHDSHISDDVFLSSMSKSVRFDQNSRSRLTLSGILNFTDGLWSCCGEQRIFIFTTNHKDRLDPALLRPGRMDMHILMSYITFPALKKMATNYLGICQDHYLYPQIQKTMEHIPPDQHSLTPASISEILICNQNDPDAALKEIIARLTQ